MAWVDYGRFQTQNAKMKEVMRQAQKISLTFANVYIVGQVGVGKRTLAQWICDHSAVRGGRVVRLSEHDLGQHEPVDGETVIVENIHEFETSSLLKIKKLIFDLNAARPLRVRWIVTSQLTVAEWMQTSSIARDLAYRLCVATLQMPGLDERAEDLADLARLFLRVTALVHQMDEKEFSLAALHALAQHQWTGHVAELGNLIERAALEADRLVDVQHLSFLAQRVRCEDESLVKAQVGLTLCEVEKRLIFQTLELTRQNKTKAAHILGISIRTLRNKLNAYRDGGALNELNV